MKNSRQTPIEIPSFVGYSVYPGLSYQCTSGSWVSLQVIMVITAIIGIVHSHHHSHRK